MTPTFSICAREGREILDEQDKPICRQRMPSCSAVFPSQIQMPNLNDHRIGAHQEALQSEWHRHNRAMEKVVDQNVTLREPCYSGHAF